MGDVFTVSTQEARQCLDVTSQVQEIVRKSGVRSGLCHVMVMHTTAALVINENDDPNVGVDLLTALDRAIPDHDGYLHDQVDNNAHAHIKSAILGPSETIAVENGELQLGTWQGVLLVELDGPRRHRRIAVQVLSGA